MSAQQAFSPLTVRRRFLIRFAARDFRGHGPSNTICLR